MSQGDIKNDNDVLVGKIAGVYGIKGWVKIVSYTRPVENILNYKQWFIGSTDKRDQFTVEACKQHGKGFIAKLEGLDDRDKAMELHQQDIVISRDDLPELEPGEYYWHDLIDLEVIDQNQKVLGKISNILETGANDVFEVSGDKKRLIPWVTEVYIQAIDLESGVIQVDWEDDE